jgi:hypothetical protein
MALCFWDREVLMSGVDSGDGRTESPLAEWMRRLAIVGMLVCVVALLAVPAASGAERWRSQPVSAPSGLTYPLAGSLVAVSCLAADSCVAVGSQTFASGQTTPSAGVWNGTTWSLMSIASSPSATLTSVSCSSVDACMAVGFASEPYSAQSFAESWNGSAWSLQQTPIPTSADGVQITGSQLSGVSCPTATVCVAVGMLTGGTNTVPFAEIWDGVSWTPEVPPSPPSTFSFVAGQLNAVSCSSATACIAVGTSAAPAGFADAWNGSVWSLQTLPAPSGAGVLQSYLDGVSCTASTACVAVGSYLTTSYEPYSEVWNGVSWSLQMMPSPAGGISPDSGSVSCVSATACTATENGDDGGRPLLAAWNGITWSMLSTPSLDQPPGFAAVSCARAVSCMLVGTNNDSETHSPLAERRTGSVWSVDSPQLTAPDGSTLTSVSCSSRIACTAVGSPSHGGVFVERWNGRRWQLQNAPSPPGAAVSGVSCASSTVCMLVGSQDSGTLTERWNGRSWSEEPTPIHADSAYDALSAVSCTSATACTAVGGNDDTGAFLAERWNGSRWSSERVPAPVASQVANTDLDGVSCSSRSLCTAVGTYAIPQNRAPSIIVTVVERWNRARWSSQRPSQATKLSAVSCPSSTSCNAIAQQWNGVRWSLGPNPNAILNSISCLAGNACIAVGSGRIERWNAQRWTPQTAARDLPHAKFNSVSCVSTRACFLVGSNQNAAGVTIPLIERSS